jgi:hypothetical protein
VVVLALMVCFVFEVWRCELVVIFIALVGSLRVGFED